MSGQAEEIGTAHAIETGGPDIEIVALQQIF